VTKSDLIVPMSAKEKLTGKVFKEVINFIFDGFVDAIKKVAELRPKNAIL